MCLICGCGLLKFWQLVSKVSKDSWKSDEEWLCEPFNDSVSLLLFVNVGIESLLFKDACGLFKNGKLLDG